MHKTFRWRPGSTWFFLLAFALSASCALDGSETGSAAVKLKWSVPDQGPLRDGVLEGVVDTIRITVSHAGQTLVDQSFTYNLLQGQLDGIPAGSERVFLVEALSGETTVYTGSATNVTINKDQTTEVPVTMAPAYESSDDVYQPAPVTDLAAQADDANVILDWTSTGDDWLVGQAASYDIRWSDATIQDSNFDSATQLVATNTPRVAGQPEQLTITTLAPGGTYYFALKVVDDQGNASLASNCVNVTTAGDATAPSDILNLNVSGTSPTSITLTWNAPGDDGNIGTAAEYDLRYSIDPIDGANFGAALRWTTNMPVPQAAGLPEQVEVTGLTTGQRYYFAIKTADEVPNWSEISNPATGVPSSDDTTAPAAITPLTTVVTTETSVTLSWDSPGDDGAIGTAAAYDVRYSDALITPANFDAADEWTTAVPTPAVAGTAQSVEITGLITDQPYYFAIKTADEVPNWSPISEIGLATPADVFAPEQVDDLAAPETTDTSVTLTWTAPGDDGATGTATSYDIRYVVDGTIDAANFATADVVANIPAPAVAGSAETVIVTPLATGVPHTFALIATDDAGNPSPLSTIASATPGEQDTDPPDQVLDLATTVIDETTIELTWIAPGDDGAIGTVTDYTIRYRTLAQGGAILEADFDTVVDSAPGPVSPVSGGSPESVQVSGLTPDTEYYFALRAVDDQGNPSLVSNSPAGTPTDSVAPGDIDDLAVVLVDDNTVTLQWLAPGDDGDAVGTSADAYEIYYADFQITAGNMGTANLWATPPTPAVFDTAESVNIDTLDPDTQYYFRIRARDENDNWSNLSNEVDQLTSCTTCPQVSGILPGAAPTGGLVYISGTQFSATAGTVTIGGQAAPVGSWTDTLIMAAIPTGLNGPAAVEVTNLIGTGSSSVDVKPFIDGITPDTVAALPTPITISGSGFGLVQGVVNFEGAGIVTTIDGWTDDTINVTVTSGVVTGPVSVTVNGYTSNTPLFTVGVAQTWSAAGAALDTDATASVLPRAAGDSNGDMVVIWNESDGSDLEIFANEYTAGAWTGALNLSNTVLDSSLGEIVVDSADNFHLVWQEAGADPEIKYVTGTIGAWGSSETVAVTTTTARPAIGVLPDSSVVVAWSEGGKVVYNVRSAAVWGTPADVLTAGTNAAHVAGAVDPAGNFHLAYIDATALQHAWFDGSTWNSGGAIDNAPSSTLFAMAADQLGQLHVFWWNIALNYSAWDGVSWGAATALTQTATLPEALDALVDAANVLHVVAEDDSGAEYDIWRDYWTPAGVAETGDIATAAVAGQSKQPCLVVTPDMKVHAFFSQTDFIYPVTWE
jgi:fibronectin type III domain protein/IPT/TIG domain-containing protein